MLDSFSDTQYGYITRCRERVTERKVMGWRSYRTRKVNCKAGLPGIEPSQNSRLVRAESGRVSIHTQDNATIVWLIPRDDKPLLGGQTLSYRHLPRQLVKVEQSASALLFPATPCAVIAQPDW